MSTHLSLSLCKKYAYIHIHNERRTVLSLTLTPLLSKIHMRTDIYREGEMVPHTEFSVPVCTYKHIRTYLEKGGESCSNTSLLLHMHKHICIYTYTLVSGKRDLLSDRHTRFSLSICTYTHIHTPRARVSRHFSCTATHYPLYRKLHTYICTWREGCAHTNACTVLSARPPIHTCGELVTHILSLALSIFLDIYT